MATELKDKILSIAKRRKLKDEELRFLLETIKDPWEEARGILKKKKEALSPVKYQKKIRSEWQR